MIELADLKGWLGVTTTAHDEQLTSLEQRAVAAVEQALDWYFGPPRDVVQVLDGTGTGHMFLRQPPVGDVVLETRHSVSAGWSTVAGDHWEQDGRGIHCVPGFRWQKGRRNFRARYQEGFEVPPGDIYQLVLELITATWKTRHAAGVQSERIGDYSYALKDVRGAEGWSEVRRTWARGRI